LKRVVCAPRRDACYASAEVDAACRSLFILLPYDFQVQALDGQSIFFCECLEAKDLNSMTAVKSSNVLGFDNSMTTRRKLAFVFAFGITINFS